MTHKSFLGQENCPCFWNLQCTMFFSGCFVYSRTNYFQDPERKGSCDAHPHSVSGVKEVPGIQKVGVAGSKDEGSKIR